MASALKAKPIPQPARKLYMPGRKPSYIRTAIDPKSDEELHCQEEAEDFSIDKLRS
jgi:hypothetical protein